MAPHWIKSGEEAREERENDRDSDGTIEREESPSETLKANSNSLFSGFSAPQISDPIDFETLDCSVKYRSTLDELEKHEEEDDDQGEYFDEAERFYTEEMLVQPDDFKPWDGSMETSSLDSRLKNNWLKCLKYDNLNTLQTHSIPMILSGDCLVVEAPTGIGKTFAFLLPAIQKVIEIKKVNSSSFTVPSPYVLILNNTTNLAEQTHERAHRIIGNIQEPNSQKITEIFVDAYIAGRKYDIKNNCDIAVATMGALKSRIENDQISLSNLKLLIIDEADKMVATNGFGYEVECLYDGLEELVRERLQVCLFSATYADNQMGAFDDFIIKLLRENEPNRIWIPPVPGHITQRIVTINVGYDAFDYLHRLNHVKRLIDEDLKRTECSKEGPYVETIGVFCETVGKVNMVASALQSAGYNFWPLSRVIDKPQQKINLKLLKLKKIQGVVSTNIMARGIDVSSIRHIIVMEMSTDFDTYRHRIGRTGRAGHGGMATVIINPMHYRRKDPLVMIKLYDFLLANNQEIPEWLIAMKINYNEQLRNAC